MYELKEGLILMLNPDLHPDRDEDRWVVYLNNNKWYIRYTEKNGIFGASFEWEERYYQDLMPVDGNYIPYEDRDV